MRKYYGNVITCSNKNDDKYKKGSSNYHRIMFAFLALNFVCPDKHICSSLYHDVIFNQL